MTETATTPLHIVKTRARVQPASQEPVVPDSASGTFDTKTPTTTAIGTAPSWTSDAPSTNDSGIPSSTVPSTIAFALPASWLSPRHALPARSARRSIAQSPT